MGFTMELFFEKRELEVSLCANERVTTVISCSSGAKYPIVEIFNKAKNKNLLFFIVIIHSKKSKTIQS